MSEFVEEAVETAEDILEVVVGTTSLRRALMIGGLVIVAGGAVWFVSRRVQSRPRDHSTMTPANEASANSDLHGQPEHLGSARQAVPPAVKFFRGKVRLPRVRRTPTDSSMNE